MVQESGTSGYNLFDFYSSKPFLKGLAHKSSSIFQYFNGGGRVDIVQNVH